MSELSSVVSEVPKRLQKQKRFFSFLTSNTVPPVPLENERKSYRGAGIWRNFTFFWVFPLVTLGYKRTLQTADLDYLPPEYQMDQIYNKFLKHFENYNEAAKLDFLQGKYESRGETKETTSVDLETDLIEYKPSLWTATRSVFMTFRWSFTYSLIMFAISDVAIVLSAQLSKPLITYVTLKAEGIEEGIGKGIGYALGLTLLLLFAFILNNSVFYYSAITASQLKALLTKAILTKAFNADSKSRHDFSASKLTSLANTDTSKIELAVTLLPICSAVPASMTVAIVLLAVNLGVTMLVSLGVIVVFLVILALSAMEMGKHRKISLKYTDMRVNFTKEIVNYLKIIKLYSWEDSYRARTEDARKNEAKHLVRLQFFRNLLFVVVISLTPVTSMVTFLVLYYVDSGRRTPANIFASLSIIDILGNVFVTLPLLIGTALDGAISIQRIFQFLGSGEIIPDQNIEINEDCLPLDSDPNQTVIKITDGLFIWESFPEVEEEKKDSKKKKKDSKKKASLAQRLKLKRGPTDSSDALERSNSDMEKEALGSTKAVDEKNDSAIVSKFFELKDMNLTVKKGEFIMITGVIGSGKSSLLNAISGLMKRTDGFVEINGSSLLCGVPWVQNATIKENVTFGLPYDEKRYSQAIFACALNDDLRSFPAGERTEVGERGITLSGGQKARLSLARAIYADKDIILLDDVLSAVDAKVGKHIMELGLFGLLKEKTRILATHQLSFLSYADKVIFLNGDGTIDYGTVDELKTRNTGFNNLMAHKDRDDKDENSVSGAENRENLGTNEDTNVQNLEAKEIFQEDDYLKSDGKLIEEEISKENSIGWKVYLTLAKLGSGRINTFLFMLITLLATMLATFFYIFTSTWLSFWTSYRFESLSDGDYIGVYVALAGASIIFVLLQFSLYVQLIVQSSKKLSMKAIGSILHAPMWFMDTTPSGRILNRFTKDTDAIDNSLVENARITAFMLTTLIAIFMLSVAYLPWLAIAFPILSLIVSYISGYFQASSRELKRMESVQRSLVLNNFSECLSGLDVIKSYKSVDRFLGHNEKYLNKTNEAAFMVSAVQRWGGFNLNLVATIYIIIVSMLCVTRVFDIGPSSVGLIISYVVSLPSLLATGIRTLALVDNDMTSFERVHEFAEELPKESAYHRNDTAPPPNWPDKGSIRFDNASLRYREGLPKVLRNVTFDIKPNERIGICGRTGAGKSTITSSLFRLVELCEGSITIDGIDIAHLGLNELRSKLSIIPQESVLFGGDIKKNLDPFGTVDDEILWSALRRAGLIDAESFEEVKQQTKESKDLHKFHLDNIVEVDGVNFSLGERQLIAFARALVRNSKILVLDEATSSVDYETDAKIQRTIVKEFKNCTILSVAHRLRTIIDYDKILVLDQGEVKEFDTPLNLFNMEDSTFRHLCEKSKITISDFATK